MGRKGGRCAVMVLLLAAPFAAFPAVGAPPTKGKPLASASASASVPPPKTLAEVLTGEAKADYDAGIIALKDKDYALARTKFEAAYAKSKDPRLLWNMASCEKGLRRYVKTRALLRRYLDEGKGVLGKQDIDDAQGVLDATESFVTSVKIVVKEEGAEVSIDGERIGTSPLAAPVVVDIGTRKLSVTKQGFKPWEKSVPVGGDKDATIDVALEREINEGKLTIRAPAGASIVIDGKAAGVGSWTGTLKAGPHTVRVTAPGMRMHQGEVTVVADGGERTVDIVLEPQPAAVGPVDDTWALHPLELGLRTGYGMVLRNDTPHTFPLWLDLGFRLGKVPYLGLYFMYGQVSTSGTCGATTTTDRTSFEASGFRKCSTIGGGLMLLFHLLPRGDFDPWFAFHVGLLGGKYDADLRDRNNPTVQWTTSKAETIAFGPGLEIGLDWHPTGAFRALSIGPFVSYSHAFFGSDNYDVGAALPPNEKASPIGGNFSTNYNGTALQLLLGLRARLGD